MPILDALKAGILTHSAEQMQQVGATLAGELPPNTILALHGDLGVGKTTFVRGLARGFGLEQPITSPTFTVFNLHRTPAGTLLVHMDAYRLSGAGAMDSLMLEDFLVEPYLLAVEWPDNIPGWLPRETLHLELSIEPGEAHRVRLRAGS